MSQLRTPGPGRPSRRHGARFGRSVVPTVVASAAALVLAACSGSSTPTGTSSAGAPTSAAGDASAEPSPSSSTFPCAADATPVTFWGWSAGYDLAVNEFNATHPEICVTIENAGAAGDEYTKLSDALKAGTGAPDVAQIEYFELPSFTITNSLDDLSQYGVGDAEANEVPAAWGQVTQGDAIYAMPVDVGPLALWYNKDQLDAAGIAAAPTTWDEFAAAADQLKAKDPDAAITNFDPETAQDVLALMQAWGAFPFEYSGGEQLGIHFTGAAQTAFARYWQGLIDKGEVTTAADFSPEQWSNLDSGKNAARLSPAWGPVGMQLSISKTIGVSRRRKARPRFSRLACSVSHSASTSTSFFWSATAAGAPTPVARNLMSLSGSSPADATTALANGTEPEASDGTPTLAASMIDRPQPSLTEGIRCSHAEDSSSNFCTSST